MPKCVASAVELGHQLALGVTVDGYRDVLGLWVGEGARYWGQVLGWLENRGVGDCGTR
ncbi:transposase [Embleya sp. NBC_00896]|uniref:transposase n=1 Tax=Embleya sp. NBC_00896 TaxID=2975961 RepID=UPI00386B5BF4